MRTLRRMEMSLDRLLVTIGAIGAALVIVLASTSYTKPRVLITNTYETKPILVLPGLGVQRTRPKQGGLYV